MNQLNNQSKLPVKPGHLVMSIKQYAATKKKSQFVDFRQNDAHEFLVFLMDCLHDTMKKKVNIKINGDVKTTYDKQIKEAMTSFSKFYKKEYSKLIPMFFGQFQTVVHYTDKNEISYSYQPFLCVQLDIPRIKNPTLYDCLETFKKTEKLSDTVYKSMHFWSAPQYLVFALKRFVMGRGKNTASVHIPHTVNICQYINGPDKYKKTNYELIAVCNHSGGMRGGHYFAFCKDKEKKWWCYNDAHVHEVNAGVVSSSSAYCLFYRRI